MKKYILHIVLFFGIVAVVDIGFGKMCNLLEDHAKGGLIKRIKQTAMIQDADVVIMGSSRAHHHYVPSVLSDSLGMTVYNAGVDGNGIVLAKGLYDMMAKRYSPKVIIYDVEPCFDINVYAEDGNNTRYIGSLRPYVSDSDVSDIINRIDPSERYKNLSAMFRYNSKIVDLVKDQVVVGDYTEDGFAPMYGEMKENPDITAKGLAAPIDTVKLEIMEEFIASVSNSNTRLIVVASPRYGAVSSEVFEPVRKLCAKYEVVLWDYYSDFTFQQKYLFKEPSHMNGSGAIEFSKAIANRLVSELNLDKPLQ